MGRRRKQRRQPHGSAWHWKQTDCWYYTQPGTRNRVPLFDERGVANGTISQRLRENTVSFLNRLCAYCGAMRVGELKKGHLQNWIESQSTWRSAATRRTMIAIVQAAFNYAEQMHEISNPLKGLKRPAGQPQSETDYQKSVWLPHLRSH